jgi:hypothetical protein
LASLAHGLYDCWARGSYIAWLTCCECRGYQGHVALTILAEALSEATGAELSFVREVMADWISADAAGTPYADGLKPFDPSNLNYLLSAARGIAPSAMKRLGLPSKTVTSEVGITGNNGN